LSSRRSVVSVLLLSVTGLAAFSECQRSNKHETPLGPQLSLVNSSEELPALSDDAGFLALAALPTQQRLALIEDAENAVVMFEARANPLLNDFVGEDPDAILRQLSSIWLPLFTAAEALTRGVWRIAGSTEVVRAVQTNPADAIWSGAAWGRSNVSPLAGSASFAAWPITRAVLLSVAHPHQIAPLVDAVRTGIAEPDSRLALVLTRELQRNRALCPEHAALVTLALRTLALAKRANLEPRLRHVLNGISAPRSGAHITPWLELSNTELLIVPRLGALGAISSFVKQVEQTVSRVGFEVTFRRVPPVSG
jgi:hypothetical protein